MIGNMQYWRAARFASILAVLLSIFGATPALAARDRTPPTRPTNLRVASNTSYQVVLAWNASTDNSGTFSYRVVMSNGCTYTVPQTQTAFTAFVAPNGTYSFYVYAVDGSGNSSQRSNTLNVIPPPDTTAPTPPVLSMTGVNPTEVSLAWTASTDDGPYLFYQVFVNGSPSVDARQNRFAVITG